jgi:integrase
LTVEEIKQLLATLEMRERTLVFLALCTGLRKSELFALRWQDIDFHNRQIRVTRSIVYKCWASAKRRHRRSLFHSTLFWPQSCRLGIGRLAIEHLRNWVFASPHRHGKKPYYGQALMERYIARSR